MNNKSSAYVLNWNGLNKILKQQCPGFAYALCASGGGYVAELF